MVTVFEMKDNVLGDEVADVGTFEELLDLVGKNPTQGYYAVGYFTDYLTQFVRWDMSKVVDELFLFMSECYAETFIPRVEE